MDINQGDRVLVNIAPFIGSLMRCEESVPCKVLAVDGIQVYVQTLPPYRTISMWLLASWIDAKQHESDAIPA